MLETTLGEAAADLSRERAGAAGDRRGRRGGAAARRRSTGSARSPGAMLVADPLGLRRRPERGESGMTCARPDRRRGGEPFRQDDGLDRPDRGACARAGSRSPRRNAGRTTSIRNFWRRRAARRRSISIRGRCRRSDLRARLARQAEGADIVIVEGVMGLFDGGPGGAGSTASLARADRPAGAARRRRAGAGADAPRRSRRAARGWRRAFRSPARSSTRSPRSATPISSARAFAAPPCRCSASCGAIRRSRCRRGISAWCRRRSTPTSRGRSRGRESWWRRAATRADRRARGGRLSSPLREKVAAKQPDEGMAAQRRRAAHPSPVASGDTLSPQGGRGRSRPSASASPSPATSPSPSPIRICLQDWRDQGAEISFFSPLADEAPSDDADAVFLPGGYPELHAGRIAAAATFRAGMHARREARRADLRRVRRLHGAGRKRSIDAEGVTHRMLGLLPRLDQLREAQAASRLSPADAARRSAVDARRSPRTNSTSPASSSEGEGDRLFEAADADGAPLGPIGLRRGRVMGSFAHVIDACVARMSEAQSGCS